MADGGLSNNDRDKLRSMVDHHSLHDVLVELAIICTEHGTRLRIVNKQNARAKLWEYMSELIIRVSDNDAVQQTRHIPQHLKEDGAE